MSLRLLRSCKSGKHSEFISLFKTFAKKSTWSFTCYTRDTCYTRYARVIMSRVASSYQYYAITFSNEINSVCLPVLHERIFWRNLFLFFCSLLSILLQWLATKMIESKIICVSVGSTEIEERKDFRGTKGTLVKFEKCGFLDFRIKLNIFSRFLEFRFDKSRIESSNCV